MATDEKSTAREGERSNERPASHGGRDLKEYLEALGYSHAIKKKATQIVLAKTFAVDPLKVPKDTRFETRIETRIESVPATHLPPDQEIWELLEATVKACPDCKLCHSRTQAVFGNGDRRAELMFVGEGPGEPEDLAGLPFVGQAGQLLNKMIEAMGLSRDKVFVTNVVKCHPPENRNPEADEIAACSKYLLEQVALVSPKVVVALGTFAAQTLLESDQSIGKLRGKFQPSGTLKSRDGMPVRVLATYHPAFCLRNPDMKKPVWEDLQKVMQELGLRAKA